MGFGLFVTMAPAQGGPSDILIPPALYAVVGAPFTATVEWTETETKADGSKVYHRRVSRIMRDSAGRQRFEDGQDEADPQAAVAPMVRLYNPTTHLFASLDLTTGVAKISTMGSTSAAPLRVPASGNTTEPAKEQADIAQPESQPGSVVMREPLPPLEIAGFHAEGVRTTTTIPAGKDGSPAVNVVDEVWESPLWRMQLLHIHEDRKGRSQAQVTALVREEPDEALFQPPGGYAKDNWEIDNQFRVVLPKPSPLPRPILDDNLANAADRMIASATAHNENLKAPYHERYELTMVDYKGQKHTGSMESWISQAGFRMEMHTDTYSEVHVTDFASGRRWESYEGIEPLRLIEFNWDRVLPRNVVNYMLHGGGTIPGLKSESAADRQLTCAGIPGMAQMCFEQSTGFIVSGRLNAQHVEYQGWKKADTWKYRVSTLHILHDTSLLVEAKLAVASMEFSDDVFKQIDGLREVAPMSSSGYYIAPHPVPIHGILVRGTSISGRGLSGYAQVRVWVDQQGQVTRAEVEDADDAQIAAAALESAQKKVYQPWRDNGQPSAFETTVFSSY
jgi:hypothetical protein